MLARVSRRELALNRHVWLATGAMFGVFAVASNLAVNVSGWDSDIANVREWHRV